MTLTSGQIERELIRRNNQITIDDLTICYYCDTKGLTENDFFCPNCGFPQRGEQSEMKRFYWNINNKKKLLDDKKKAVKKARNILYILAVLNLLYGIIMGAMTNGNLAVIIGGIIGAAIYLALAIWSKTNPFPAILTGFFVYIVFNVIAAIGNPTTIYQGIIWKIIIISGFIYGYKGVKDSKNLEIELETIKKAKDLNIEN